MQSIFEEVIDKERGEREYFLKEVIPAFRAAPPEPPPPAGGEGPTTLPLESLAAAEGRVAAQSNGHNSAAVSVRRRPTTGGQVREETREDSNGMHLPGVTQAPDPAERRRARREAAMRVLAELAAEGEGITSPPEQGNT